MLLMELQWAPTNSLGLLDDVAGAANNRCSTPSGNSLAVLQRLDVQGIHDGAFWHPDEPGWTFAYGFKTNLPPIRSLLA